MTEIYCVKFKKKKGTVDVKQITTENNKKTITGVCNICGSRRFMFVSSNINGSSLDIHK